MLWPHCPTPILSIRSIASSVPILCATLSVFQILPPFSQPTLSAFSFRTMCPPHPALCVFAASTPPSVRYASVGIPVPTPMLWAIISVSVLPAAISTPYGADSTPPISVPPSSRLPKTVSASLLSTAAIKPARSPRTIITPCSPSRLPPVPASCGSTGAVISICPTA